MDKKYKYDVALSFAGSNREYVEDVATFLKNYGIKVFYDKFEQADLWGKDLYEHLNEVYKNKAKYTIIFISEEYAKRLWTNHERKAAQTRAFKESEEYILPIRFDETELPGLNETVGYLDASEYSSKEIAKLFLEKNGFSTKKRWWGTWEAGKDRNWFEQELFITKVSENGFDFELICIHGAHIGNISGFAKFISTNEAVFEEKNDYDDEICKLHFYKMNDFIQITEVNCNSYHGARAYFDGNYELKKDIFYYYDEQIDDTILNNIYALIGKKYWGKFQQCFGDTHNLDDLDGLNTYIISGGIAGLYTIQESILLVDNVKNVWGAFINDEDDKVYYFASLSQWKNKIPLTIEKWRENFKDKELIFLTEDMIQIDEEEF